MRARIAGAIVAIALIAPTAAWAQHPGSPDPSFGTGGTVSTTVGGGHARAGTVALAPDGSVFAGGSAFDAGGIPGFAVAKYAADGRLDRTFGANGAVVLQLGEGPFASSGVAALLPEADGGVTAVGTARRNPDGEPDSAIAAARFDRQGGVVWQAAHHIGRRDGNGSGAWDAARRADGKIVVAGYASVETLNSNVAIAVLDPADGLLDESFGDGKGYVSERRDHSRGDDAEGRDMLLLPSGTVVVAGAVGWPCGHQRCIEPLLQAWSPDGRRDPSFASGPLGLQSFEQLALAPDGTIAAVGFAERHGMFDTQAAVARYTARGELDTNFAAPAGFEAIPAPPGFDVGAGLAVQPDGRLVAATVGIRSHLLRILPDGTRDDSFGYAGLARSGIGVRGATEVVVQKDGRMLVVGSPEQELQSCYDDPGDSDDGNGRCAPYEPVYDFALARVMGGTAAGDLVVADPAPVRRRVARLALECTARGATACAGALKLTSKRRRGVSFGRAGFALPAGERATVEVSLTRTALRRLRRAPGRRLTAHVRVADANGRTLRRRVTLVARGSLR